MYELCVFLSLAAWPLVALVAIAAALSCYREYAFRRDAKLDAVAKLAAAYESRAAETAAKVDALSARVGQLELVQGVKRR